MATKAPAKKTVKAPVKAAAPTKAQQIASIAKQAASIQKSLNSSIASGQIKSSSSSSSPAKSTPASTPAVQGPIQPPKATTPQATYVASLASTPNLSSSSSYIGSPTYKAPAATPAPYNSLNLNQNPNSAILGNKTGSINASGALSYKPTGTVSASPSSTGTTGTKITTPAGQQYIANQIDKNLYMNPGETPAQYSARAAAYQSTPGYQTPSYTAPTATATADEAYKKTPEYKAYLDYTMAQQNPAATKAAQDAATKAAKEAADKQKKDQKIQDDADKELKLAQNNVNEFSRLQAEELTRERGVEKGLRTNAEGKLEGAQSAQLNEAARLSNASLADLAIAKGLSVDILKQLTDAGKTVKEAAAEAKKEADTVLTPAEIQSLGGNLPYGTTRGEARKMNLIPKSSADGGFSLKAGETQYDKYGNLIAGGGSTESGTYVAGQDPVVDSWISFVNAGGDMSKVPENLRNSVVQGVGGDGSKASGIQEYMDTRVKRSLDMINDIKNMVGYNTTGVGSLLSYIPGTDATDLEANLSALKANIGFSELTAMRAASPTGGALGNVSDTEIRLLTDTLGGLSTRQSPANFNKNLATVQKGLTKIFSAAEKDGLIGGGDVVQTSAGAINTNW